MYHVTYLTKPIEKPGDLIHDAVKKLYGVEFDGFVGTGVSGAMGASLLAHAMSKKVVIIRKDSDNSHSATKLEGNLPNHGKWLFVDDLVDTGTTLRRCKKIMEGQHNETFDRSYTYVGMYLYHEDELIFAGEEPDRRYK
jgi:orotate phosphoribosyltransferase